MSLSYNGQMPPNNSLSLSSARRRELLTYQLSGVWLTCFCPAWSDNLNHAPRTKLERESLLFGMARHIIRRLVSSIAHSPI